MIKNESYEVTRMEFISSINNQKIKDWKKLQRRKEREKQNAYMIEGFHIVEEALKSNREAVVNILIREDVMEDETILQLNIPAELQIKISGQVAAEISETETNQGVFAIITLPDKNLPDKITGPFLVLDAVQDPGNVGTMIRTADAAGFQGVFLGKGTVDLYNAKTIRSAQGSHFHLAVYAGEIKDLIEKFNTDGLLVYGTALDETAKSHREIAPKEPFALVMGNEGAGVSPEVLALTDQTLYIPIKGEAESLNVAIAAGILMFHLNSNNI